MRNMTTPNRRYKELQMAKEEREKKLQELNVKNRGFATKRRAKKLSEQIAKIARIVHFRTQLKKVKK